VLYKVNVTLALEGFGFMIAKPDPPRSEGENNLGKFNGSASGI
jgi:hypothetical protein